MCLLLEKSLMDYNLQANFIFLSRYKKSLQKMLKNTHSHFLLHFIMGFDLRYRGTNTFFIFFILLLFDHAVAAVSNNKSAHKIYRP